MTVNTSAVTNKQLTAPLQAGWGGEDPWEVLRGLGWGVGLPSGHPGGLPVICPEVPVSVGL